MSEPIFFKSSYSGSGDNCVEVAFRKSSYSGSSGAECVEVADTPTASLVRDTQNRTLGHLDITPGSGPHSSEPAESTTEPIAQPDRAPSMDRVAG
ncbi:DUF397 domain-containing protein [Nocardiopsis eucommiae]|uniref:DUF397 domain-containing protein n=1 Tax=Nocardiopsis eucommiae TaxID=2831970 RepID=A0A975QJE6_9ACTN|nr:DUF397 domain-containing protein [Nocardiopsis eucommiae]